MCKYYSTKRTTKLHCKITLQKCTAKWQCKIALQNCIAKLHCKIALQNCTEKFALQNCTAKLHWIIALQSCTLKLHSKTALQNCTAKLHVQMNLNLHRWPQKYQCPPWVGGSTLSASLPVSLKTDKINYSKMSFGKVVFDHKVWSQDVTWLHW